MTLPTFLVIGALKAGTTSLWGYLRAHPQIFMPIPKELRFFVEQHNWSRGVAWYESHFAATGDALALGEASPSYTIATSFPGVPARIASVLPDAKLIYVLRHPVDRMRSHYLQRITDGTEHQPAERAFMENLDYLHTSRYAFQLEQYLEHFDLDRILLVTSEDMRDDRVTTLQRIYAFIGVDETVVPMSVSDELNRSQDKKIRTALGRRTERSGFVRGAVRLAPAPVRRMARRWTVRRLNPSMAAISPELERQVVEALRPDIVALRRYMPADFDGWGIA